MAGELSEDGNWVWDGAEWKPFSSQNQSNKDTKASEKLQNVVDLKVSKLRFLEEKRVKIALTCLVVSLLSIFFTNILDNHLEKWCEENWTDLDVGNQRRGPNFILYENYVELSRDDGAPLGGVCYIPYQSTDIIGASDIGGILILISIPTLFATPLLLVYALLKRNLKWYCGSCGEEIEKKPLLHDTRFDVKSTSDSTKKITTSSPQVGIGRLGGKSGSFISMGSSTSHVPTVLGRISASHECHCSIINQWQFDAEVQVWTDAVSNEISHDITGIILLPK
jgi:hypothetical protein